PFCQQSVNYLLKRLLPPNELGWRPHGLLWREDIQHLIARDTSTQRRQLLLSLLDQITGGFSEDVEIRHWSLLSLGVPGGGFSLPPSNFPRPNSCQEPTSGRTVAR